MTSKQKKKKETTPASNGTQLKSARHSVSLSLSSPVAQTLTGRFSKILWEKPNRCALKY
jgi:hypothetical protein